MQDIFTNYKFAAGGYYKFAAGGTYRFAVGCK
jgi:hypothetical protein